MGKKAESNQDSGLMKQIAVVTGGGGFLGKALCKRLIKDGYEVRAIQRSIYPELEEIGVTCFQEDISNPSSNFTAVFKNAEVVFHVAAKVDMWGAYESFYAINVVGTENILNAAQLAGVEIFIYTSSPSVIASGKDLCGIDESEPYPEDYKANYPKTKAMAEQLVLAANSDDVKTCSLRPHLIWGPGDTNLIPTVLERAKKGKLVKVGSGNNLVDLTFIEDCVEAHINAKDSLKESGKAAGKAFFISQGDPVSLWDWIDEILVRHRLPKVSKTINPKIAYFVASILEYIAKFSGREPLLSRFLVEEMATDHYFDISAAKNLLGFRPRYTVRDALELAFPK